MNVTKSVNTIGQINMYYKLILINFESWRTDFENSMNHFCKNDKLARHLQILCKLYKQKQKKNCYNFFPELYIGVQMAYFER